MGTLLLIVAYGATGLVLTGIAFWLLGQGSFSTGSSLGRPSLGRPSLAACTVLFLLPLPFVAGAFLPGTVLAPTNSLLEVAPWTHPHLEDLVLPGSSTANPLLVDPLSQMEPWREAARRDWLFNPAASSGAALLANGQSAVLFPPEIVARLLPPVQGAGYSQAAKLLIAVWGMFLLLRSLALREAPALLGTIVFVGSAFLQLWRMHTLTYVVALTPWLLFMLLRLARRPGPGNAALVAVVGALGAFAGHPETMLQSLFFGCVVVLPTVLQKLPSFQRPASLPRLTGWASIAALVSALLAAPFLLPFVENLLVSAEWQHRQAGSHQNVELPLSEALARTAPALDVFSFGDPRNGTWEGPENLAELGGASLALAALALIPAAFCRRRRRRQAALWLGVGLLGLMVASHYPVVSAPFGWLPLIRDSLLNRLQLWWVVAVSVLAAIGVSNLSREHGNLSRERGKRAVLGAAVALAGLLSWAGAVFPTQRETAYEVFLFAQLALLVLVVSFASRRRFLIPFLAALLLLPQAAIFHRWIPASEALSYYPTTPAVEYVRERSPGFRVAGLHSALFPHSAAFFGLEDVRGYDPMMLSNYEVFTRSFMEPRRPLWNVVATWEHPGLDFLGVRFLFDHPSNYIFHHVGVRQVYEGEDALVFENPKAFDRVFRPETVEIVAGPPEALWVAARIDDFAQVVSASGEALPPPGTYPNGEASIENLQVEAGSITFQTQAGALALLATSQPAIPGWQLRDESGLVDLVRVNGAFLGVLLPPGNFDLELRYAPRSWDWARGLFLIGLLGLSGLVLLDRRRRRVD